MLFPPWTRNHPLGEDDPYDTPEVPPAPTATEDLSTKPATQRAYRDAYASGYAPIADGVYEEYGDVYRRWYHRFHAEVDRHIDGVRRAVTEGGSSDALLVLSADHGELLGAHGGLHQKWFNAYDETVRVPFVIARVGTAATAPRIVDDARDLARRRRADAGGGQPAPTSTRSPPRSPPSFSEVHPLPGTNLLPVVDGAAATLADRSVYLITRDNILEGDTGASVVARALGLGAAPPPTMLRPAARRRPPTSKRSSLGSTGAGGSSSARSTTPPPGPNRSSAPLAANSPDGRGYRSEVLARRVGALRPHRRPDRGRQPLARRRRRRAHDAASPASTPNECPLQPAAARPLADTA